MSYPQLRDDNANQEMMLVTGNANRTLAKNVAARMLMRLTRLEVDRFTDGEVRVEFEDHIRGKDVYILQSIATPVNTSLMELMLIADAARRGSARSVTAVVPYLGYSRQDRRPRGNRTPISAAVVADLLTAVGISRMVTVDVHAEQIQGFYRIPFENIYASPVLLGDMTRQFNAAKGKPVMISPDIGGVARARAMATQVEADLAIIDKRRSAANVAEAMHIIGDVADRNCILIDDMIDTAGTLRTASEALRRAGAKKILAYCTHLVLSGRAIENITESHIDEVVGTDSLELSKEAALCSKIRCLSVADLLAESLSRIHGQRSIGSLFI